MVQVHFQFLTQALQKVQPVAHSCFAEAVVPEKKSSSGGSGLSGMGHTPELEEAVRSWRGAAEVTLTLGGRALALTFCVQTGEAPEGLCPLVLRRAFLIRNVRFKLLSVACSFIKQ